MPRIFTKAELQVLHGLVLKELTHETKTNKPIYYMVLTDILDKLEVLKNEK